MAIRSAQRSEADNTRLAALAAAYTERHAGMESYVLSWKVAFALLFGVLGAVIYRPLRQAIGDFLSLHRLMADLAGLEHLVAWDRRWFHLRVAIPAAALFAAGMFALTRRRRTASS